MLGRGATVRPRACTSQVLTETPCERCGLETGLEALGQPERDARIQALVGRVAAPRLVVGDVDELGIPTRDAHLDPALLELAGELERGLRERLQEAPADRRLERAREELGCAGGGRVTDRGDAREVVPDRFDVSLELHGRSMTSL